jgi:hypothetical protein
MKIDLHAHTYYSRDSVLSPIDLVRRARDVGLDGIAVTEHHSVEASEPLERIARETKFPIFRGMEYSTDSGHLLVFGLKNDVFSSEKYLPIQEVIDAVNNLGGVAIPSHPFHTRYRMQLCDKVYELRGIPALETLNASKPDEENQLAELARQKLGLKGTGGSDAHSIPQVGRAYTVFEYPIKNVTELVVALRTGNYHPERLPEGI